MRLLIVFSVSAILLAAADRPAKKAQPRAKAPASTVNAPKALEIPAGAVEIDGSWHYTDTQGRKWIYRKTPFGVARMEDKPNPRPPATPESYASVKATEDGEYIRFERPGPFGTYQWQTKKTELNEMEQAAWKRARTAGQD